jgi:hypothetical protein
MATQYGVELPAPRAIYATERGDPVTGDSNFYVIVRNGDGTTTRYSSHPTEREALSAASDLNAAIVNNS